MSDAFVPAIQDTPAAPEAAAPAASETPAAPEASAAEQTYQFSGTPEQASAEIRRLRDEAASRRLAVKNYEEAFTGFSDEEKGAWLELGRLFKDSPDQAREAFRQLAQLEAQQEAQTHELTSNEGEPLTRAELLQVLSERDAQTARANELTKIDVETSKLGLKPGSLEYQTVLQIALDKTNGDINKAHEEWNKFVESKVQAGLEAMRNTPSNTPPQAAGGTHIPNSPTENIKSFKDARSAAKAYLAGLQQQ